MYFIYLNIFKTLTLYIHSRCVPKPLQDTNSKKTEPLSVKKVCPSGLRQMDSCTKVLTILKSTNVNF